MKTVEGQGEKQVKALRLLERKEQIVIIIDDYKDKLLP